MHTYRLNNGVHHSDKITRVIWGINFAVIYWVKHKWDRHHYYVVTHSTNWRRHSIKRANLSRTFYLIDAQCTFNVFFFFHSSQLNWFDFLLIDRLMMIMNRENGANAIFNFLLMRNNNQKIKHENYASGRNNWILSLFLFCSLRRNWYQFNCSCWWTEKNIIIRISHDVI